MPLSLYPISRNEAAFLAPIAMSHFMHRLHPVREASQGTRLELHALAGDHDFVLVCMDKDVKQGPAAVGSALRNCPTQRFRCQTTWNGT